MHLGNTAAGLHDKYFCRIINCDSKCKSILSYLSILSFTRSILWTAEPAVRLCPENWPKITWQQGNHRFTPIANPKLLLTDLKSGCKPSFTNLPGTPASLRTYQMDVEGVKTTKPSTFHPYGRNLGLCLCTETFFFFWLMCTYPGPNKVCVWAVRPL